MADKCQNCGSENTAWASSLSAVSLHCVECGTEIVRCEWATVETFPIPSEENENQSACMDLTAAIEELSQENSDTGEYDFEREEQIRELMRETAHYAEGGPTFDPTGRYLCGSCIMRADDNLCETVSGTISLEMGGCEVYWHGDPGPSPFVILQEKYAQNEVGYSERPEARGFGCAPRCSFAVEAQMPDLDGRTTWCKQWRVHVGALACCDFETGPDIQIAPNG